MKFIERTPCNSTTCKHCVKMLCIRIGGHSEDIDGQCWDYEEKP